MSYTNYNIVIPQLYISNWESSEDINFLKNNNIKLVMTLENTKKSDYIIKKYTDNNIYFIQYFIDDNSIENIYQYFDVTSELIKKFIGRGQNVLVHCRAGISRSATIIMNYIIRILFETHNIDINIDTENLYNYVLKYIRQVRPINPNAGFKQQLLYKIEKYKRIFSSEL